jgi:hypothetical protein
MPRLKSESLEDGEVVLASLLVWFLASIVGISWIGSRSWDVFQALTGVLRSCSWRVIHFTEFLRGQHMLTRIGLLPVQMFLTKGISYFFLVCLMTYQHNNFAYFLNINF